LADRFIRLPEVKVQTGRSRSAIYAEMADGSFPRCIKISSHSVAWLQSEITAWMEARIAQSRRERGA
jgi:prophage regulatory protein